MKKVSYELMKIIEKIMILTIRLDRKNLSLKTSESKKVIFYFCDS